MSKAAELAALIGSQTALSNRNLIINGAMQVAQRGTSVTGVTSGAYRTCDRMLFSVSGAGTWTKTQQKTTTCAFPRPGERSTLAGQNLTPELLPCSLNDTCVHQATFSAFW